MRYDELTDDQRAELERTAADLQALGFQISAEKVWDVARAFSE